jgi:flagellin-specific chaperone FliS
MVKSHKGESISIKNLETDINDGSIFLDPEYQRDIVWSNKNQCSLITTILNGFFIPQIILKEQDDEGVKECVDGKQRLTSIHLFIRNEYSIVYDDNKKCFFKDLEKKTQRVFLNYKLTVIELSGYTDDEIIEQFQKIQFGEKLRPAELLYSRQDINCIVKLKEERFNVLLKKFTEIEYCSFKNTRKELFRRIINSLCIYQGTDAFSLKECIGFGSKIIKKLHTINNVDTINELYKNLETIYDFLSNNNYNSNELDILHLIHIAYNCADDSMKKVCKHYFQQKNEYDIADKRNPSGFPKNTEWYHDNRNSLCEKLLELRKNLIKKLLDEDINNPNNERIINIVDIPIDNNNN